MCVNPNLLTRPTLPCHHCPFVVSTHLELPQRLKSKRESYHILMHMCGISKNGTDEPMTYLTHIQPVPQQRYEGREAVDFPTPKKWGFEKDKLLYRNHFAAHLKKKKKRRCWSAIHQCKIIFKLVHNTIKEETEGKIVQLIGLATV